MTGVLTVILANDAQTTLNIEEAINPRSEDTFSKARLSINKISKYAGLYPDPFIKGENVRGVRGESFGIVVSP